MFFYFKLLLPAPKCRAVIIMGSSCDQHWAEKIAKKCEKFGVPVECRISSAHKGTNETLRIVSQYEGMFGTCCRKYFEIFFWLLQM